MATEITIKEIVSAARHGYVHLGLVTHDAQRFVCIMSPREHASILSALIRAGLDCENSALQEPAAREAFLSALVALDGSDKPPSAQVN